MEREEISFSKSKVQTDLRVLASYVGEYLSLEWLLLGVSKVIGNVGSSRTSVKDALEIKFSSLPTKRLYDVNHLFEPGHAPMAIFGPISSCSIASPGCHQISVAAGLVIASLGRSDCVRRIEERVGHPQDFECHWISCRVAIDVKII